MFSSGLYRSSPIWLQEFLIAARGYGRVRLREGRQFERFSAEAERTQWLDADELQQWQRRQLNVVLAAAAAQVPFYRERWAGIERSGAWADAIERLPMIDKPVVRAAGRALLSEAATHPLFEGSTSGTTGAPLKLYQDLAAVSRENAFIWRQLRWAGYRPGEKRAWIRGDMAVPQAQSHPPYWRHNAAERMLILSSYHLSAATARAYLDALRDYAPAVIQAYPSSISFLAACLRASDRYYEGDSLKAVVTSSESLHGDNRALIEERFGCRVFDWYGQFERVAAIGTCEHGSLHVIDDYGYVEFAPAADGLHEIVGTGFNNRAMPLVRYRTGDFVELADADERCNCGRHFRLVRRIVGRDDDMLKLRDGRVIGRLAHVFDGIDDMLDAQIRQDTLDEICISVVPAPNWDPRTAQKLERNARQRLGPDIGIRVETTDSIERDRNGKYRRVVCRV
jgi:phenylacetate-CoA ligase